MIEFYDSGKQAIVPFEPLENHRVRIYLCGATVQGEPHIGHLRTAVAFDVIIRYLEFCGFRVDLVRNITDIDDKILAKSAEQNIPFWQIASQNEQKFSFAYQLLNCKLPSVEPKVTWHIPQIVAMISKLIDFGYAYIAPSGSVYFDTDAWKDYGEFTHQYDDVLSDDASENINENNGGDAKISNELLSDKKSSKDFALWKVAKANEPKEAIFEFTTNENSKSCHDVKPGRPGWHIECSAMSTHYLGESFDIHGGGLDLRFPHHENEIAQAKASGYPFAKYWLHTAWVTQKGEKMSKSLGNYLGLEAVLSRIQSSPRDLDNKFLWTQTQDIFKKTVILRYVLASAHYRSNIEYSDELLSEANENLTRIGSFCSRCLKTFTQNDFQKMLATHELSLVDGASTAMDNDFNVVILLSKVFDAVRTGNKAIDNGDFELAKKLAKQIYYTMEKILGINLIYFFDSQDQVANSDCSALISLLQQTREKMRLKKDFETADFLRERLAELGIGSSDGKI